MGRRGRRCGPCRGRSCRCPRAGRRRGTTTGRCITSTTAAAPPAGSTPATGGRRRAGTPRCARRARPVPAAVPRLRSGSAARRAGRDGGDVTCGPGRAVAPGSGGMEGAQRVVLPPLGAPLGRPRPCCGAAAHAAIGAAMRPLRGEPRWLGAVRRDALDSQGCRQALSCIVAHLCGQLRGLTELRHRGGHGLQGVSLIAPLCRFLACGIPLLLFALSCSFPAALT